MMVIAREGEGPHILRLIHDAATEALEGKVLPVIREVLPEIADLIILHGLAAESPPARGAGGHLVSPD